MSIHDTVRETCLNHSVKVSEIHIRFHQILLYIPRNYYTRVEECSVCIEQSGKGCMLYKYTIFINNITLISTRALRALCSIDNTNSSSFSVDNGLWKPLEKMKKMNDWFDVLSLTPLHTVYIKFSFFCNHKYYYLSINTEYLILIKKIWFKSL